MVAFVIHNCQGKINNNAGRVDNFFIKKIDTQTSFFMFTCSGLAVTPVPMAHTGSYVITTFDQSIFRSE